MTYFFSNILKRIHIFIVKSFENNNSEKLSSSFQFFLTKNFKSLTKNNFTN